ncbi:MAG: transposase [Nocardioidaceae bacterium]
MSCVREYGQPMVDDPDRLAGVHTLGVDETAFLAATPTRHTVYATGIVALNGRARLLDVVPGRSGSALSGWVCERHDSWRAGITVAALDPFRGYATALHATLPDAIRVLDAFHVVKVGFDVVDAVRRRIQQETLGHAAAATIRCSGSGGRCAAASSTTVTRLGQGCWPGSTPATTTSRSAGPGSPPKNSVCSTGTRPGHAPSDGCWPGSPSSPSTRSLSYCGLPAPWTPGEPSCSPTSTPAACPTDQPRRPTP